MKHILISSNRSDDAIAIQYRLPGLLALPFHYVAAMFYIPIGN